MGRELLENLLTVLHLINENQRRWLKGNELTIELSESELSSFKFYVSNPE